jgi:hypothetical protein
MLIYLPQKPDNWQFEHIHKHVRAQVSPTQTPGSKGSDTEKSWVKLGKRKQFPP